MTTDEDPKAPAAKPSKPKETGAGAPSPGPDTSAGPGPQPPTDGDAKPDKKRPDPTRYGDWEKNGRCIDF
jgi:hypothetical protein